MWKVYQTSVINEDKIQDALDDGFEPFAVVGEYPSTVWLKRELSSEEEVEKRGIILQKKIMQEAYEDGIRLGLYDGEMSEIYNQQLKTE